MYFHHVAPTGVVRVQLPELMSLRTELMIMYQHREELGQSSFSKTAGVTCDISGLPLGKTETWATHKLLTASFTSGYFSFLQRDSGLRRFEGGQCNSKEWLAPQGGPLLIKYEFKK